MPVTVVLPSVEKLVESASSSFFGELKRLSIEDVKALQPSGKYVSFVQSLIALRIVLGD